MVSLSSLTNIIWDITEGTDLGAAAEEVGYQHAGLRVPGGQLAVLLVGAVRLADLDLALQPVLRPCSAQTPVSCQHSHVLPFRYQHSDATRRIRRPPCQLQEALKERTKADTEYNLPTWVLKTRVDLTKGRS